MLIVEVHWRLQPLTCTHTLAWCTHTAEHWCTLLHPNSAWCTHTLPGAALPTFSPSCDQSLALRHILHSEQCIVRTASALWSRAYCILHTAKCAVVTSASEACISADFIFQCILWATYCVVHRCSLYFGLIVQSIVLSNIHSQIIGREVLILTLSILLPEMYFLIHP